MDIKSMNDVQKQLFQRVIQKLVARNQCSPSEIENMQKILDNVRDTKNFHAIMEKLKDCGQIELDSFEENPKEGEKKLNPTDKMYNKNSGISRCTSDLFLLLG